jgi:hypothetical protein
MHLKAKLGAKKLFVFYAKFNVKKMKFTSVNICFIGLVLKYVLK